MKALLQAAAAVVIVATTIPAFAQEQSTTIGGYGEAHMRWSTEHMISGGKDTSAASSAEFNIARFVVFLSHNFNDWITLRSELEVEDTKIENGSKSGEVALEQMYMDFSLSKHANIRAGLVLVPVGIVNETHEPPTFNGVARPSYDHNVIPSTWREVGAGAWGEIADGWNYRAYIMASMLSSGFERESGIYEGKQEGQLSNAKNLALTGKLEYSGTKGLKVGASFFYGGTSGGDVHAYGTDGDGIFAIPMTVLSADAQYSIGDLALRGVFTTISLDADKINKAYHTDSAGMLMNPVSKGIGGFYFEAAYNVMKLINDKTGEQLSPFVRFESYDLNQSLAAGASQDDALKHTDITVGLTYKPAYNVVVKADWQSMSNKAFGDKVEGAASMSGVSLGVGYMF